MEPEIRHVRFFNGQFLQEQEFRLEKDYHIHMRRRLNYVLFDDGVLQITANDLTIAPETANPADKRVRIRRGMAVGSNHDTFEAREIIQRNDSQIFDLAALGFGAGQTVWVTVNYRQDDTDPVSLGGGTQLSRTNETAEIRFHSVDPTGTLTPGNDPLIVLGSIDFTSMAVTETTPPRQQAVLRAALQGGPAPAGPTITGINPTSGPPGAVNLGATISGTSLAGATAVVFSGAGVTANIVNSTTVSVAIQINITAAAATGPRTFTVTTPIGPAVSGGVVLNVSVPLGIPVINPWNNPDRRRHGTETLTIFGDQFGAPLEVFFPSFPVGGPDVVVIGIVDTINQARVVVPGPFIPTPATQVVSSGSIRVRTTAGTSAPSPNAFILETV